MSPVDGAAEVLAFALAGGLVLLGLHQLFHFANSEPIGYRGKRPNRIPAREMELLGEDYRDHTTDYFRRWSKRRAIVRGVCRGDR